MRAFKFMMADLLKSRLQVVFLVLFGVLAYVFMVRSVSPLNGLFYLSFGAVMMGIQPFMQEQSAEVGFLYMLPGRKTTRVAGRYLYGLMLQLMSIVLALADMAIYVLCFGRGVNGLGEGLAICFSTGLIFCSLQYILFYVLGRMKSQQMASIIMMIPGFLMFFGFSFLFEKGMNLLKPYLQWIKNNVGLASAVLVAASLVIWLAGILISGMIVKNRDDV